MDEDHFLLPQDKVYLLPIQTVQVHPQSFLHVLLLLYDPNRRYPGSKPHLEKVSGHRFGIIRQGVVHGVRLPHQVYQMMKMAKNDLI